MADYLLDNDTWYFYDLGEPIYYALPSELEPEKKEPCNCEDCEKE